MKKPVNNFNLKGTYEVPLTRSVRLVTERFMVNTQIGGG